MPRKPLKPGDVTTDTVGPGERKIELSRATRHLDYVLGLGSTDDIDQAALEVATQTLKDLRGTDMAAAALLTNMPGEAALVLWNRARRALHSLAPVVMMRLAAKMDDSKAPGNTRVLIEIAKGIGLLVPAAPQDETDRETNLQKRDLADMPTAELRRRILEGTTGEA